MSEEKTTPILLGEAPSRGGDRYHIFPLSGPPARVLCTLAGIPPQEGGSTYGRWTWALYARFECRNLFSRYAEAAPWSVPAARERARALRDGGELDGRVVVCLGRRVQAAVADAFDVLGEWEFHEPLHVGYRRERGLTTVAAIPHPSGLNRALNDPAERHRCGETLRWALETASNEGRSA